MTTRPLSLALLGLLVGCATPNLKRDKELAAILEAYRAPRAAPDAAAPGVRRLTVGRGEGGALRVSVELEQAWLSPLTERILKESGVPYVLRAQPAGTVSARFEDQALLGALNLLLRGQGLVAEMVGEVLTVDVAPSDSAQGSAAPPKANADAAGGAPVLVEVPMMHLDSATASNLLGALYPSNPMTGPPLVRVGIQPYTNTILLAGPADEVARAERLMRQTDRAASHVVIEVLVVEFDSSTIEQLGLELSGLARKELSAGSLAAGSLLRSALSFTYTEAARNPAAFTATLDALVARDKARLLSRPYIATLSGKPALIQITRDRYVVVQSPQEGAAVTTTNPVSSGISLNITPTVSADGHVRLDMDVEDSQFIPTLENVAVEVDKNHATTSMLVESGQSAIIGGLVLNRRTASSSGVPVLRDIPLLNLLFGRSQREAVQQEVVVYVTPHVWRPGMSLPLAQHDALTIQEEGANPDASRGTPRR